MDEGVSEIMKTAEEHKQVRQKISDKIYKQMNKKKCIHGIAAWSTAFQCQSNSKSANQESSGRDVTEDSSAVKLE